VFQATSSRQLAQNNEKFISRSLSWWTACPVVGRQTSLDVTTEVCRCCGAAATLDLTFMGFIFLLMIFISDQSYKPWMALNSTTNYWLTHSRVSSCRPTANNSLLIGLFGQVVLLFVTLSYVRAWHSYRRICTIMKAILRQAIADYSSTPTDTMSSPRPTQLPTSRQTSSAVAYWTGDACPFFILAH